MTTKICAFSLLLGLAASTTGRAEPVSSAIWAAEFYSHYRTTANVIYKATPTGELKLDVYQRSDISGPVPTVFYVHGGGWVHLSKDDVLGDTLPWLEMGWTVVNVNYRLAREAPAPAAVEDCRSALRWVADNAGKYRFDLNRLVFAGASAGGELVLVLGMEPPRSGLPLPKPAAIVSFSGVIDVVDFIAGPDRKDYAVKWMGNQPNPEKVARSVSPFVYVRPGLPPILTVQGDADPVVPYLKTVRFNQALTQAGVPNQLFPVPGGKHGGYTGQQYVMIYQAVRNFLAQHNLTPPPQSP